jgi:hypothetical protein
MLCIIDTVGSPTPAKTGDFTTNPAAERAPARAGYQQAGDLSVAIYEKLFSLLAW